MLEDRPRRRALLDEGQDHHAPATARALEPVDPEDPLESCGPIEPVARRRRADSYEGDGTITMRDQSTEVVKRVLNTIIGTAPVYYAD